MYLEMYDEVVQRAVTPQAYSDFFFFFSNSNLMVYNENNKMTFL